MSDGMMEAERAIERIMERDARKGKAAIRQAPVIEDGFGNAWANWCHECEKYSLEVVRPGKVQCGICGV